MADMEYEFSHRKQHIHNLNLFQEPICHKAFFIVWYVDFWNLIFRIYDLTQNTYHFHHKSGEALTSAMVKMLERFNGRKNATDLFFVISLYKTQNNLAHEKPKTAGFDYLNKSRTGNKTRTTTWSIGQWVYQIYASFFHM